LRRFDQDTIGKEYELTGEKVYTIEELAGRV
jgi:hypothetical protein